MNAQDQWSKVMAEHSQAVLPMGPTNVDRFIGDPKRMAFFFSRYKFAAKMLRDATRILDIGCGDGMGAVTFLADTEATQVDGIDFEPAVVKYANDVLIPAIWQHRPRDIGRLRVTHGDFMRDPIVSEYDGVVSLDVIEHLEPEQTDPFFEKLTGLMARTGVAVIGTPSENAAQFASKHSQIGHINLFTPARLRHTLADHFDNVFLFSMNDEMVHTGFEQMAHYLMALCVGPKRIRPYRPGL